MSNAPRYSAPDVWQSILDQLAARVIRQIYENWLKETVGLRFEGTVLIVGVPSELSCDWLATRLSSVVAQVAKSVVGAGLSIQYEPVSRDSVSTADQPLQPALLPALPPPLNPRYTFDTLFEGEFNRFAISCVRELIERPESACTPLRLLAPGGCGKTHLLHAFGHEVQRRGEHFLLVNADQFLGDFSSANRHRTWPEFRARYRDVDLLLVDDIHLLEGKVATQAEFHQTVVALQDSGRRLIVTAEPARLCDSATNQRWALTAEINAPTGQDGVGFLKSRAAQRGIDLPDEVAQYMAYMAVRRASLRDLEAAFNQVVAYARLTQEPIGIDMAAKAMLPFANPSSQPPKPLPAATILAAVCRQLNVSLDDLRSVKRTRSLSQARHIAMYLLRQDAGLTHSAIAQLLAKKDHSTVVYGCSTVAASLASSPELRADIDTIRADLTERFTAA